MGGASANINHFLTFPPDARKENRQPSLASKSKKPEQSEFSNRLPEIKTSPRSYARKSHWAQVRPKWGLEPALLEKSSSPSENTPPFFIFTVFCPFALAFSSGFGRQIPE
jgi:hypothetical protein